MPPTMSSLFDPAALAVVVMGTVIATLARCGLADFREALGAATRLVRGGFAGEPNRKALAQAAGAIQRDGPRRADPPLPPDPALAALVASFLRHGALETLAGLRRADRAIEDARRYAAVQVYTCAGELAPVFGLIGTLYGLTQLAPVGAAGVSATATIMAAVSTAVLTSLYGALIAHLVCFPLASAIERRGLADEAAREALADWFVAQAGGAQAAAREHRAHHLRGVA
ncbi:MAG: MotA/TolQ/ExbB proton channel family protein [Erythrobacter sp.]|uniref:MotA/TolQ/ExbB proton channel family protein n=1 Tax=Erythrobacter sp. TaxID=1042 RepID=UPI0025F25ABE|nr:MotA/TolQ/ExbB proton channel family protein [Erythrobacter sp.]MCM0000951.1 MotA/TolQ/ExbB proton channel family protein [Erythrobacter sp.]